MRNPKGKKDDASCQLSYAATAWMYIHIKPHRDAGLNFHLLRQHGGFIILSIPFQEIHFELVSYLLTSWGQIEYTLKEQNAWEKELMNARYFLVFIWEQMK